MEETSSLAEALSAVMRAAALSHLLAVDAASIRGH